MFTLCWKTNLIEIVLFFLIYYLFNKFCYIYFSEIKINTKFYCVWDWFLMSMNLKKINFIDLFLIIGKYFISYRIRRIIEFM